MTEPITAQQLPQPDPRGWLAFDAPLPNDLQNAEDSTAERDMYGWSDDWTPGFDTDTGSSYVDRAATDAERQLLEHLGYTLPDVLTTRVSYPTALVRRRRWPQLETETTP